MTRVLVADEEDRLRVKLEDFLRNAGYEVEGARDVPVARSRLKSGNFDVVVSDIVLPRVTDVELLGMIRQESPRAQVIMVTGQPTETAAAIMRAGAFDCLYKPVSKEAILRSVGNAARLKAVEDEWVRLAEAESLQKTKLVESYNRLRNIESLRDNLVHMIIHDLRAPLSGIMGYLDLLKTDTSAKLSLPELKYLDLVCKNTAKIQSMVTAVLDVSRLEASQMPLNRQPYDLGALAKAAVESLGSLVGLRRVSVEAPPEPVMAKADKAIIERVMTNLLSNALKFTPESGDVRVAASRQDGKARVAVVDTGPGIPAEYHRRIFEKFGALDTGARGYSTGLGLVFCKLAVQAHGGEIGVESEPGKGSAFWFTLPAA